MDKMAVFCQRFIKKGHMVYGFVKEEKKTENLFYQNTVEKIFVNNLINLQK